MKRILIVDDSPATRALVSAALSVTAGLKDFRVEIAASGLDAIKTLSTTGIDLVITDVNMPDINGHELIRFIKGSDRLRRIPVIVMSTDADATTSLPEADDRLSKPFTADELRRLIDKHLKEG